MEIWLLGGNLIGRWGHELVVEIGTLHEWILLDYVAEDADSAADLEHGFSADVPRDQFEIAAIETNPFDKLGLLLSCPVVLCRLLTLYSIWLVDCHIVVVIFRTVDIFGVVVLLGALIHHLRVLVLRPNRIM